MLRHAIYFCVFVLSFTAAQAETAKNYFGTSAVLDAKLDYGNPNLYDVSINNGFILSYGRQANSNLAIEFAHVRYLDTSSFGGSLSSEVTAIEISRLITVSTGGPFIRLGYSDGDLSTRVGDAELSESESGPIIGVGFDIPVSANQGALRIEYTTIEYDNAEADRLTLGTLIRF